jgi:hypothetical protein
MIRMIREVSSAASLVLEMLLGVHYAERLIKHVIE